MSLTFNIKTVEGICTTFLVALAVLVLVALLSNVFGCSWYQAEDSVKQGDPQSGTIVTKKSSSVGFGRTVTAPTHTASSIGTTESTAGATEWEDVSSFAGLYLLYWFGGIAILAGIAGGVFFKRYYLGASIAAAGLVLIMVAQYTWILLVVAALGLAAGVWFVLDSRNRNKVLATLGLTSKSLKQTIDGVQDVKKANPEAGADINVILAGRQDDDAQALVKKMKD